MRNSLKKFVLAGAVMGAMIATQALAGGPSYGHKPTAPSGSTTTSTGIGIGIGGSGINTNLIDAGAYVSTNTISNSTSVLNASPATPPKKPGGHKPHGYNR